MDTVRKVFAEPVAPYTAGSVITNANKTSVVALQSYAMNLFESKLDVSDRHRYQNYVLLCGFQR